MEFMWRSVCVSEMITVYMSCTLRFISMQFFFNFTASSPAKASWQILVLFLKSSLICQNFVSKKRTKKVQSEQLVMVIPSYQHYQVIWDKNHKFGHCISKSLTGYILIINKQQLKSFEVYFWILKFPFSYFCQTWMYIKNQKFFSHIIIQKST